MNAAYSSEFASNVMAPTLRRNFLFINPGTGKPVFEYRGGIYITPGCDIDGFTAQLVCVSRLEKTKYPKSVKCVSDQTCACLNAPSAQYYQLPVTSAGKLTQSVPFQKSFHVTQIFVKFGTGTTIVTTGAKCGPADIGPTNIKGNMGYCLPDCSSRDKDISDYISHEDYQCKESGKKCCIS